MAGNAVAARTARVVIFFISAVVFCFTVRLSIVRPGMADAIPKPLSEAKLIKTYVLYKRHKAKGMNQTISERQLL